MRRGPHGSKRPGQPPVVGGPAARRWRVGKVEPGLAQATHQTFGQGGIAEREAVNNRFQIGGQAADLVGLDLHFADIFRQTSQLIL